MEMVECQICKIKFKRISPTHLKHKHDMTMSDYKTVFPDAQIESKDLTGLRVQTLENMIIRYGHYEGTLRWERYKQKQSYSNSFEYKNRKYGMTLEEYQEYNRSRGTSGKANGNYGKGYLHFWVDRYGEDVAREMNLEVSKKKDSRSLNWFVKKYGKEVGRIEYDIYCDQQAERALELILNNKGKVIYNKESIPLIETYAQQFGYSFKHAENGGEHKILRYYVDAFDENNKVILEYYEQPHKYRTKADRYRMERILRHCGDGWKFIELWYDGKVVIHKLIFKNIISETN